MDELDPYYDYTGSEQEYAGNPESTAESAEAAVEEEILPPVVLGTFDPRRFHEVETGETVDPLYSVSSRTRANVIPRTAVMHESGRVSIHPLGITEKPAGVTGAYWSSLDSDRLSYSPEEINSLAVVSAPSAEETSPISEQETRKKAHAEGSGGSGGGDDVPDKVEPDHTEMPFLDHLEEFRWALLKSIFAITVGIIASWFLTKYFYATITELAKVAELPLIYTKIMEPIMIKLQMALFMGIVLSLPFVFYFIWSFVSPGLYKREKKWILPVVIVGTLSFFIGASIAYFIIIPFLLKFIKAYMYEGVIPMLTIGNFISSLLKFTIFFGVIFEMPLISFILAKIGIIKYTWMTRYRKYAIVFIFIIGAIFTPPDPISQIMMALPLILLYEISIQVARIAGRKTLI